MNDIAHRQFLLAIVSILLAAIGTAAIVWSLGLARSANKHALDAVKVTQRIADLTTRAWLACNRPVIGAATTKDTGIEDISVEMTWVNVGKSPARDVQISRYTSRDGVFGSEKTY